MNQFTENEWAEFRLEVLDLLDAGEQSLLAMAKGESFAAHYDTLFRAFHNIKGVAAMVQLVLLRDHVHQLENILTSRKTDPTLPKEYVTFFLKGIDAARRILNNEKVQFDYSLGKPKAESIPHPTTPSIPTAPKAIPATAKVIPMPLVPRAPLYVSSTANRVLILDDSKAVLTHLSAILTSVGFEVMPVGDPIEAMKVMSVFQPNVVLTDMMMPGMSGTDVLREVQRFDAELPVIFISGCVTKNSMLEAIQNGAFSSIQKPFSEQEVIQLCFSASRKHEIAKTLSRAIELLMYQYTDLDDYLKSSGKSAVRAYIRKELAALTDTTRLKKVS